MARLHSKLFGDGEDDRKPREGGKSHKTVSDDEEKKLERLIEQLATDAILILKKAVGQDWTADALAEKLLKEYECGAELASSMHEIFSKDKDKLQRSFARGTFGMVKRLESACWRTQVSLYDSKTSKNNTAIVSFYVPVGTIVAHHKISSERENKRIDSIQIKSLSQ